MKSASFDIRFLDYIDGTMSSEEQHKFLRDLAENKELRSAFEEYQHLISMEGRLRKEFTPSPALLNRIMAEVDDKPHVVPVWISCMSWMSKKQFVGGFATAVVVCMCILIVEDWPEGENYNGVPVVPVPMVVNKEVPMKPVETTASQVPEVLAAGPVAVEPLPENRVGAPQVSGKSEEQVSGSGTQASGGEKEVHWEHFTKEVNSKKSDSSRGDPLKMSKEDFDKYIKELAGDPSKTPYVEPSGDSPPAFKAIQACLQSGDYDCANEYAEKYTKSNALPATLYSSKKKLTEEKLRKRGLASYESLEATGGGMQGNVAIGTHNSGTSVSQAQGSSTFTESSPNQATPSNFQVAKRGPVALAVDDVPAKEMQQNLSSRVNTLSVSEVSRGVGKIISSEPVSSRSEDCRVYREDGTVESGGCYLSNKGPEAVIEHRVPQTSNNMVANALEDEHFANSIIGRVLTTNVGNARPAFSFGQPSAGQILDTALSYSQQEAGLCQTVHYQHIPDLLSGPGGDTEAKAYLGCIRKKIDTSGNEQGPPCQAIAACQNDEYLGSLARTASPEIFENARILTQTEALSTFSIDVDTGSYTNIRNLINHGTLPDPTAVRIEELINYFDYTYPNVERKPFGVSYEMAPSPFNEGRHLLRIGVATTPTHREKSWNLVFLVDVSGSMADSMKLDLIKRSLHGLVGKMKESDSVAIVTYAASSRVALEPTSVRDLNKIRIAIDGLVAGGSTNGGEGIRTAYQLAHSNMKKGGVNRVILATDGDFNIGVTSDEELIRMIEQERESGVTLTTVGVGTDNYKESKMEQLADKGNGNYFYLDNDKEARRVFGERLMSTVEEVAKDVKLQIEFNPAIVLEYRLVGYDNRVLKNVEFTNDRVDAGELGSGHTVTALYEVTLNSSPVARRMESEYRYQPTPKAKPGAPVVLPEEFAFLKIRYKQPEGTTSEELQFPFLARDIKPSFEQASKDFQFTTAVLGFGSLLRESMFRGSARLEQIIEIAQASQGADPEGQRRKFVELVKSAGAIKGSLR